VEIKGSQKGADGREIVPLVPLDSLLNCLTLGDVRELARFEEPTLSNPDPIGGSSGREIELSPGALPREVYAASLVSEALLFFVIIYFGAFVREALLATGFPVPGTLFSAFYRSRLTLVVMVIVFCAPVVSSLGLAFVSRRWMLWVLSSLILFADASVLIELQRRSYFRSLNPHKWRRGEASAIETESESDLHIVPQADDDEPVVAPNQIESTAPERPR
jgi:hypothetical protein